MKIEKLTILAVVGLVAAFMAFSGGQAQAAHCDATVTAPASIQAAIDANPGDVVCLDDSGGVFSQSVIFGPEDSGITLSAEDGDTPVLDGTGTADSGTTLLVDAIRLLDGVSGVTINGLEIRDYTSVSCCGQGNAIQAWAANTSNITVRNNYMHDNSWSAILVGSEGAETHSGWAVHHNILKDNATLFFSAQLELTNCNGCSIHHNTIDGGVIGILVQARNTVPDSGLVPIQGVSVKRNKVGEIGKPDIGVYLLSLASGPLDPFPPIVGAQSKLQAVSVGSNNIESDGLGVLVWGFLGGEAINPALVRNDFFCDGATGIWLVDQITNAKVVNNDFVGASCTPLVDGGDETKNPLVPANPS